MHLLPLALYAAAAAAYAVHFTRRDPRSGRLATAALGAGVLAHTFVIGMQTMQAGNAPLVGTTAAVSAFVWLLGLSYLYVELTTDERSMGAFVTMLLALLAIIPALDPTISPRPPLLQSPLFTRPRDIGALRLRQLRARLRARADVRAAVQGNQGEAARVLLRAPAVAAGARQDERPGDHRRLDLPDCWSRGGRPSGPPRCSLRRIRGRGRCRSPIPRFSSRCCPGVCTRLPFLPAEPRGGAAGARRTCRHWPSFSCS